MECEDSDTAAWTKRRKLEGIGADGDAKATAGDGSSSTEPSERVHKDASIKSEFISSDVPISQEARTTLVKEEDVGITEYISNEIGFGAIIKQRYSDFHVNEIDMSGNVVHLTNYDIPSPIPETQEGEKKDISEVLSAGDIEKLTELVENGDRSKFVRIECDDDKEARTKVHQAVKDGFPGTDSSTIVEGDEKYIQVKITDNRSNGLRSWPKGRPEYLRFILYKENKDTMDTIGLIAKLLRVKPGMFQYAGTKDKRAKTSQEVTVYRLAAEKMKANSRKLRNIATGNYRYVEKPLKLGRLQGNKFTIILRNVTAKDDNQINVAMTLLRDKGFINYYGMQRFGTTSIPTHHIGRALLKSDWKEAVELILKPRAGAEISTIYEARRRWFETRDAREALKALPHWCYIERSLLQGLHELGEKNYANALHRIPRNTRLMYVHSYQSYIWNTMVSRYIREFGLKARVGDLVLPKSDQLVAEVVTGEERVTPAVIDGRTLRSYTVQDVVLPLPGWGVTYPSNEVKMWYQELLAKDGLDIDNMRHNTKDYSLPGAYRKIVIKPMDVAWRTYMYDDITKPLALSDFDRINGTPEPESEPEGKIKALKLEMSLPTACYATMALREILKIDTSSGHQSTLNTT